MAVTIPWFDIAWIDSFLPSSPIYYTILRRMRCCELVVWACVHLVRAVQQRGERGVGIKNKLKKLNVWKGNPSCSFVEILEREEYRFRFRFRERFRSVSAINKDAFFFHVSKEVGGRRIYKQEEYGITKIRGESRGGETNGNKIE